MYKDGKLLIARTSEKLEDVALEPSLANRHGLIAGATGTGKTVTLKTIAEAMSMAGIPVFIADIKGDVSGMGVAGQSSDKLLERLKAIGVDEFTPQACPVEFWDVFGEKGNAVRTSISEMGPMLLGRLLDLTDVQQGVLQIVFRVADDNKWLLVDLNDLRAVLAYVGENAADYTVKYGNVSKQSIGAVQRALLQLEDAGGESFFGEPALDINDWIRVSEDGRGIVNILECDKLFQQPLLYSTFMLWMLTELYENLPEVGDLDKPKICFFFDEAHLLFDGTASALEDKIEQIVKLIRSKGVGVYFITQNPADIPDAVLAQLGNRVQHALRAYTPKEQKAIKTAAESFRANPDFNTVDAITDLGTGEALISFLDDEGRPSVVQRAKVIAPACSMGAMDAGEMSAKISSSALHSKYAESYDPESAYEILTAKANQDKEARAAAELKAEQDKADAAAAKEQAAEDARIQKEAEAAYKRQLKEEEAARKQQQKQKQQIEREAERMVTSVAKSVLKGSKSRSRRTPMERAGEDVAGELVRGVLGMLLK